MMLGVPKIQVPGNPVQDDKTLNQAYINAIKKHIELLEEKKRMFEHDLLILQPPIW